MSSWSWYSDQTLGHYLMVSPGVVVSGGDLCLWVAKTVGHHCFNVISNLLKTWFNLKFRVFFDVAPCSHVEVDRRFRGAYCLHHQGDDGPDDGGSTHLWNVGPLQRNYTALHSRRLYTSYPPLWEPEISHDLTHWNRMAIIYTSQFNYQ
jgi:hypothetical protein